MSAIDWSEWWVISAIAFGFLVIGGVTGFRAGARGLVIRKTLALAAKRGAYAVLVIPILVALVLAHTELAKLGADVSSAPDVALWSGRDHAYVKVHPEGLEHGLKLNYEGFWKDRSYNCGSCWGCFGSSAQFGSCAARSPRDLNEVVDECIAVGAVWAFLAPMWAILGAFPLLGSATVGYSMGLGRKPMQP